MFELFRYTPKYQTLFMVSKGRVGTIGTHLLNMYGIECVSTAGRKKDAVHELAKRANQTGKSVFLMADGSKGPDREARWGAIYLARETGLPLIATHAWGDNLIVLKRTWMKLALPKPWGRSGVLSAEPVYIPSNANKAALELYRQELEKRLNGVADALVKYYAHGAPLDEWGEPQESPL